MRNSDTYVGIMAIFFAKTAISAKQRYTAVFIPKGRDLGQGAVFQSRRIHCRLHKNVVYIFQPWPKVTSTRREFCGSGSSTSPYRHISKAMKYSNYVNKSPKYRNRGKLLMRIFESISAY